MIRPPNYIRRLPLPANVAQMTEAHEPALAVVNGFIEQLCDLPAESWLAIGRAVIAARSATTYARAWTTVEQAIAKHRATRGRVVLATHTAIDIDDPASLVLDAFAPPYRDVTDG